MSVKHRSRLINIFREILESVDFYNSASCILGLAEVPDLKPPKLGWIQIPTSLEDLVEIPGSDTAKLTRFMNAVSEISRITYKCMNDDKQYMCFIDNCDDYVKAWGIIFDADLKCAQFDLGLALLYSWLQN